MTLAEILAEGRALPLAKVESDLRSLAMDPRFPAVLGWLDRTKQQFVSAGCAQGLADHHGAQSHAMGSVYAIQLLQAQLANLIEPAMATGGETQPEED